MYAHNFRRVKLRFGQHYDQKWQNWLNYAQSFSFGVCNWPRKLQAILGTSSFFPLVWHGITQQGEGVEKRKGWGRQRNHLPQPIFFNMFFLTWWDSHGPVSSSHQRGRLAWSCWSRSWCSPRWWTRPTPCTPLRRVLKRTKILFKDLNIHKIQ